MLMKASYLKEGMTYTTFARSDLKCKVISATKWRFRADDPYEMVVQVTDNKYNEPYFMWFALDDVVTVL